MPGLGIDFSSATSEADSHDLWEGDSVYAAHSKRSSSNAASDRRVSRWSDSTRASQAFTNRTSRTDSLAHRYDGSNWNVDVLSYRSTYQPDPSYTLPPPSLNSRPSQYQAARHRLYAAVEHDAEVQPPLSPVRSPRRRAFGSEGSQASIGPRTPTDDVTNPVSVAITSDDSSQSSNYFESPRKAPCPPSNGTDATTTLSSRPTPKRPLQRRSSLSQSMMRTLSGRKREVVPPPPIQVPAMPMVPRVVEMAPIVHHVTLPPTSSIRRSQTLSKPNSPTMSASGFGTRKNEQAKKESGSKTPVLGSFSSIMRSLRRNRSEGQSRKNSTASSFMLPIQYPGPESKSPSLEGPPSFQLSPTVPSPSLRQARRTPGPTSRSYDFAYLSTSAIPASPRTRLPRSATDPGEGLRISHVDRLANSSSNTANEDALHRRSQLHPRDRQASQGDTLELNYNPWGTTYTPAEAFVSQIPISPRQPTRSRASVQTRTKRDSKTDASLYKQSVLMQQHQEGRRPLSYSYPTSAYAHPQGKGAYGLSQAVDLPPTPPLSAGFDTTNFEACGIDPDDLYRRSFVSVSERSEAGPHSPGALSPSQPAPLAVVLDREDDVRGPQDTQGSRKTSTFAVLDREAEQAQAPHIYFETRGAMRMRNPFAPISSPPLSPASSFPIMASPRLESVNTAIMHKRTQSAPVIPPPSCQVQGRTSPTKKSSKKASKRQSKKAGSDASIEFAFVRRRSEAAAGSATTTTETAKEKVTIPILMPEEFSAEDPQSSSAVSCGGQDEHACQPPRAAVARGPLEQQEQEEAIARLLKVTVPSHGQADRLHAASPKPSVDDGATPTLLQHTLDDLLSSPNPGFRNPFLASMAPSASSLNAGLAGNEAEANEAILTTPVPTFHISDDGAVASQSALTHSSRAPMPNKVEHGSSKETLRSHRVASSDSNSVWWAKGWTPPPPAPPRRNLSSGDTSLRRPSGASGFSVSSFPTKPTKLEARRRTDFSGYSEEEHGRGIRVSLDSNFF